MRTSQKQGSAFELTFVSVCSFPSSPSNDDSDFQMVSSMELENLASTSSGPIRATRDGASDEDDEDERSRMLSRTELDDSEDDDEEEGLKSLRRDLEKMEQEDEDEGSVESMVRKVSLLQRETRQEGREGSWLMLSSDQGGDGC